LTVSSVSFQRSITYGDRTWPHEVAPAMSPVWAMSPTTVMDLLGQRRISVRHAIADSSCASSMMMCPNVHVRSAAARSAAVS
jgi:hypothetical protein